MKRTNQETNEGSRSNIVLIPIDKIRPCRWGSGIRDKEKFEQLKQQIKDRGMDDMPHFFQ